MPWKKTNEVAGVEQGLETLSENCIVHPRPVAEARGSRVRSERQVILSLNHRNDEPSE